MSTSVPNAETTSSSLRLVVVGGLAIFALHLLWDLYLYGTVYLGNPAEVPLQYVASGVLGMSAFEGGWGTALVGLAIHLLVSLVVSAVFIAAAMRLRVVRQHPIVAGLLYGVAVLAVMTVITALSQTPKGEVDMVYWASATGSHLIGIGLVLGVLVRRSHLGT